MTIFRILCFRQLLQRAEPASRELEQLAETLALRLGVKRLPKLLLLPVRITPAVWSLFGRPRILLPSQLAEEMDPDQLETILAHELRHISAGRPLVRVLELAVTTVFWWNPLVWWVRRNLREMEEQCCDALVLESLPDSARRYAIALIETVAFLSQQTGRLPIGATAAQPTVTLKRRIEMLKHGSHVRRLSYRGIAAMLAVLIVPMSLAFAQKEPTATELKTVIYRLGDLNGKEVEQDIRKGVAPLEWTKAGGPYSLKRSKNGRLIITASPQAHEQVKLMLKLRTLEQQEQALRKRLQALNGENDVDVTFANVSGFLLAYNDDKDATFARVWDLADSSHCKQCHENDSVWLDFGALGKAHAINGKHYHSLMGLSVLPLEDTSPKKKARKIEEILASIGLSDIERFMFLKAPPEEQARMIKELQEKRSTREKKVRSLKDLVLELQGKPNLELNLELGSKDLLLELQGKRNAEPYKTDSAEDEVSFFLRDGKLYKRVLALKGKKDATARIKDGWLILPVETSDADLRLRIDGQKPKAPSREKSGEKK